VGNLPWDRLLADGASTMRFFWLYEEIVEAKDAR
jgi:hypothetical protein